MPGILSAHFRPVHPPGEGPSLAWQALATIQRNYPNNTEVQIRLHQGTLGDKTTRPNEIFDQIFDHDKDLSISPSPLPPSFLLLPLASCLPLQTAGSCLPLQPAGSCLPLQTAGSCLPLQTAGSTIPASFHLFSRSAISCILLVPHLPPIARRHHPPPPGYAQVSSYNAREMKTPHPHSSY